MQITLHSNSHKLLREAEAFLRANPELGKALGPRFDYRVGISGGHFVTEASKAAFRYHRPLRVPGLRRF